MRTKKQSTVWIMNAAGWIMLGGVVSVFAGGVDLDQCLTTALKANPDLQAAGFRLEAARAAVREASSAYYPMLGLSGNWARTDNPPQAFFMQLNQRQASLQKDFNQPDDTENVRGSVGVQWRLFDSGRREADRRGAREGSVAAGYLLEAVRNDLAYQVTCAYYGVLKARDYVAVQTGTVASIEENLRVAGERVKAGSAMKTDALNLDVQLSQAREELIRSRNGLQLAVVALNTAVGETVLTGEEVSRMDAAAKVTRPPERTGDAIEGRPEWLVAEAQARAMEAIADRARREYLPSVSAMGSVDWDSGEFSDFEQSYFAGAVAELNLFDGFRNRSGLVRARAYARAARADQLKLRNALRLDHTQAVLGEREAWERLDVSGRSMANAEEALRITKDRYQQGAAGITELMTVQVGLTATRSRQVAAHYDCLMAKANVERAAGVLGKSIVGQPAAPAQDQGER